MNKNDPNDKLKLDSVGFAGFKNFSNEISYDIKSRSLGLSSTGDSYKDAMKNSYSAPQKFLEEQSRVIESMQTNDVFEPYRRRTVMDRENDYQKQWRKSARNRLSPERYDPFNPNSKKDKNTRTYGDLYREHEVQKELSDLEREVTKTAKRKLRMKKLKRQQRSLGRINGKKEFEPPEKRRKTSHDEDDYRNERRRNNDRIERRKSSQYDDEREERRREYDQRDNRRRNDRKEEYERYRKNDERKQNDEDFGSRRKGKKQRSYEWGKPDDLHNIAKEENVIKELPSFKSSGLLSKERMKNERGISLKWTPPHNLRDPTTKWRVYIYKNGKELKKELPIKMYSRKYYMFGRDDKVVDITLNHDSISKQHSVVCFKENKRKKGRVGPYLIDLKSVNGSFLNGKRVENLQYIELRHLDEVVFGKSSRSYLFVNESKLMKK